MEAIKLVVILRVFKLSHCHIHGFESHVQNSVVAPKYWVPPHFELECTPPSRLKNDSNCLT